MILYTFEMDMCSVVVAQMRNAMTTARRINAVDGTYRKYIISNRTTKSFLALWTARCVFILEIFEQARIVHSFIMPLSLLFPIDARPHIAQQKFHVYHENFSNFFFLNPMSQWKTLYENDLKWQKCRIAVSKTVRTFYKQYLH